MIRQLSWHSLAAFCIFSAFVCSIGTAQESNQLPDAIAKCWDDLASENAELAFQAAGQLVKHSDFAVKLLASRMMAAKAPDHEKIQIWIRDLSNENFAVRTNATQALLKQGELAEHLLRKALDGKLDLETRRRIDALLSKIDQPVDAPEKLRQIRAIEVLEMLHGDQAQELLQRLAKGYVGHRQTRLAQESLSRLQQRSPAPETWLAWAKNSPASDKDDPLPLGARARLGTKLFRHEGHGKPAAFTADSQMVISHDQNAIYFWKAKTGELERKIDIAVGSLAVMPKGTLLALGVGGEISMARSCSGIGKLERKNVAWTYRLA